MQLAKSVSYRQGFTRVELVALVLAVSLIGILTITAETTASGKSSVTVCQSNLRQLMRAWQMYADDHAGTLAENNADNQNTWVRSIVSYSGPESADTTVLTNTAFGRYVGRTDVYRCPADPSRVRDRMGTLVPRNRSYSMNGAVGAAIAFWLPSPRYKTYTTLPSIVDPSPSKLSIFLEEHPDSINDGAFGFEMPTTPQSTRWVDHPAAYHDRAMSLSYADGHTEVKRWVDPRTSPPVRFNISGIHLIQQPNNPDILWMASRISAPRD